MATSKLIQARVEEGVRYITICHDHPACVMTAQLQRQLSKAVGEAITDDATRVVVFRSSDPDFFISHFDVSVLLPWTELGPEDPKNPFTTKNLQALESGEAIVGGCAGAERMRRSGKVFIAEVAGRAGGGGNEFCSSCDMRFGLAGKTIFNQMEVPLGLLPGGNGTVNMAKHLGRGRALEWILGAEDVDAATAERWGYLNRVFATREELSAHVERLARRIASFSEGAVASAKASTLFATENAYEPALRKEQQLFAGRFKDPASAKLMRAFLEQGGQTRAAELRVGEMAPFLPRSRL